MITITSMSSGAISVASSMAINNSNNNNLTEREAIIIFLCVVCYVLCLVIVCFVGNKLEEKYGIDSLNFFSMCGFLLIFIFTLLAGFLM